MKVALVGLVLWWFASPTVANAESWILWEYTEGRPRLVDSPFPSQAACASRGQARIAEYRKQVKPPRLTETLDGGLTLRVRWQARTNPTISVETLSDYRTKLDALLTLYEKDLARKTGKLRIGEIDAPRGVISEAELRARQRAVMSAQSTVDDTRRSIADIEAEIAKTKRQKPVTGWVAVTPLSYQCWPVGVNP